MLVYIILRLQSGHTALMKAAEEGHAAIVQIFLDAGADVDEQDNVSDAYFWGSVELKFTC